MATINDDPVTRFTTAQILPTEADIQLGQFFGVPQLTQVQIDEIPVENLVQGMVVFNTDYDCYMGFVQGSIPNTPGRWCNFNASVTYNGSGYEAGSPFALPLGPRSIVETVANNMDPGVMYVDSENNNSPRIYIPSTGWQDVGISGGSPTFTDLTVTNNTTLNNLNVTGATTITGATTTLTNNLIVGGGTNPPAIIYGHRAGGQIYNANTPSFTVASNIPIKIPGGTSTSYSKGFIATDNRLQFVAIPGVTSLNLSFTGTFSFQFSAVSTVQLGITINSGLRPVNPTSFLTTVTPGYFYSLTIMGGLAVVSNAGVGDYLELWLISTSAGTFTSGGTMTLNVTES